jgi:hypothetical protein
LHLDIKLNKWILILMYMWIFFSDKRTNYKYDKYVYKIS